MLTLSDRLTVFDFFYTEIKLKIKGEAEVHWTEQHSRSDGNGGTQTYTEHYRNEEKYFKGKVPICGEGWSTS